LQVDKFTLRSLQWHPLSSSSKEGWHTSPRPGLSGIECTYDQQSIPIAPDFGAGEPTMWCEILHKTQCLMGVQQCAYERGR
jgi:hypothetical protein